MKKQLFSLAMVLVCFLSAAKTVDATITPDFSTNQTVRYVLKNSSTDTLIIESITVTSLEVSGTTHLLYENEAGRLVRCIGKTDNPFFCQGLLMPGAQKTMSFLFEKRIHGESVTIVVCMRNRLGERFLVVCDRCITEN
jgi:hypothetical protein